MAWLMGGGAPKSDMSYLDENAAFLGADTASGATPNVPSNAATASGSTINPAAAQFLASMLKSQPQQPGTATPALSGMPSPLLRQGPISPGDFLRQAMTIASLRQLAGGGRGGA